MEDSQNGEIDENFAQINKLKNKAKQNHQAKQALEMIFFFIQEKSTPQIVSKILELYNLDEQIITPSKKGDLGDQEPKQANTRKI